MSTETKFLVGDQVRVVNYGALTTYYKPNYQLMIEELTDNPGPSFIQLLMGWEYVPPAPKAVHEVYKPANLIQETEDSYLADTRPDMVGQVGIVTKATVTQGRSGYSLSGVTGKCSWYNDEQLELVNRHPQI